MTIEEILAAMRAIIDAASADDGAERELTDEEAQRYETLEKQLATVRRSQELRSRQRAYETPVNGGLRVGTGAAPKPADTLERAFNHYMRTGQANADIVELRAQSEGVPGEGGYLVPDSFRDKLIERMKEFGGIGNIAERYTTGDGRPVEWPTVDDTGNVGEVVEENGTWVSGADLVFGTNQLNAWEYMAGGAGSTPLRLSYALVQDSAFDLEGKLAGWLGTRIARIQAVHFATGSGVKQPLGLVTGRTPVQAAANTAFTWFDFVTWKHSIDPAYRNGNCRWVMNDNTLALVEKIPDADGDPLLITGGRGDQKGSTDVATILGYPVTVDQAMPDYDADDSTDLAIAFGDIRAGYVIRDIKDVQLLVNPYSRMNNRQIEYSAWARCDATQQDTNAYIVASGKS